MRRPHRKPEVYGKPYTGTEPVKSGATPLKSALQLAPMGRSWGRAAWGFLLCCYLFLLAECRIESYYCYQLLVGTMIHFGPHSLLKSTIIHVLPKV